MVLKKIILLLVIIICLAGVLFYWTRNDSEGPGYTFLTTPVERGNLKVEINSTGTVKPVVEVLVGSQVSGYIKELYADFESQVTKGQLIALIDPDTFKAKVEQARADLLAAKANLAKAEVTLIDEKRTLKRKEGLIGRDSISQSDYDTQQTKTEAAAAQVEVERARIAQAEARLHEAELQLKYAHIEAPVTGVVTS
ncbi:MAG: biotin/lipoyl-binding protein, partial [Syntrophaceae bacterium]|nr:biotin/lipoyl-binding protein [Syntrophaceae bacterium]